MMKNESDLGKCESEEEMEESRPLYNANTPIVLPQLVVAGEVSPAQDLEFFISLSPNLLIATPGRLLELFKSPHVQCPESSFEVLVLDEADRLLDMGFKDDIQKIIRRLPKQRRTGLFSATVGESVDQIVRVGLRNPVKIAVKVKGTDGRDDKRTPARCVRYIISRGPLMRDSLQMSYLIRPASCKWPTVSKILSALDPCPNKTIIYLSTCAAVDYFRHIVPRILPQRNGQPILLGSLHGKQQQKMRKKNLTKFANATTPALLLTTDVAARGLDISQVDLVIQIDPPNDPRVFLHRCGRAGRAGRKGLSIIFLQPGREEDYLPFLEIRKTPLSRLSLPNVDVSHTEAQEARESMRKAVFANRVLHDKAQRGFVSWAKAYSKHQASSIFRLADQDWEELGHAWALLKLPKMPGELKNFEGDTTLGVNMDWGSYKYKDAGQEQARQKMMAESEKGHPKPSLHMKKDYRRAWSQKLDQRDERENRRLKKHKKREREKWKNMTPGEREKHHELESMVQQVKRKVLDEDRYEQFDGFDD